MTKLEWATLVVLTVTLAIVIGMFWLVYGGAAA